MSKSKHYLRNDIILIVSVILVSLLAVFLINANKTEGGKAVVVKDGKEVASYPLNIDTEVKLENNGGYNILVIKDGCAYIKEASCPDKICVNHSVHLFSVVCVFLGYCDYITLFVPCQDTIYFFIYFFVNS